MSRVRATVLTCLALSALGCPASNFHAATVELEIDGQRHDYRTERAQVEERSDPGTYSVYLHREPTEEDQPFVYLRTFSGNPVRRLVLRQREPGVAEQGELIRYDCSVPGKLADGRDTLTWTDEQGRPRKATETGERDCAAEVRREGDALRFTFAAQLRPSHTTSKKGAPADAPDGSAAVVTVRGSAVIELR